MHTIAAWEGEFGDAARPRAGDRQQSSSPLWRRSSSSASSPPSTPASGPSRRVPRCPRPSRVRVSRPPPPALRRVRTRLRPRCCSRPFATSCARRCSAPRQLPCAQQRIARLV